MMTCESCSSTKSERLDSPRRMASMCAETTTKPTFSSANRSISTTSSLLLSTATVIGPGMNRDRAKNAPEVAPLISLAVQAPSEIPYHITDAESVALSAKPAAPSAGPSIKTADRVVSSSWFVVDFDGNARRRADVAGRIARDRRQWVRAVGCRGRIPGPRIGAGRVFDSEIDAVQFELHTDNADVVRGAGRHGDRAGDRREIGRASRRGRVEISVVAVS